MAEYYGDISRFESVLEANPHIRDVLFLEAGTLVYLEEINTSKESSKKTKEENVRALW